VATQDPSLYKGLDPYDKGIRVYNFQANTIKATKEMMEACGFSKIEEIRPSKFFRKIDQQNVLSFDEIYFKGRPFGKKHRQFLLLNN
jgi:hypothetical protein